MNKKLPDNILNNIYLYLVDINSKEIPNFILDPFWEIKNELGSRSLGIVKIEDNTWHVSDSEGNIYYTVKDQRFSN